MIRQQNIPSVSRFTMVNLLLLYANLYWLPGEGLENKLVLTTDGHCVCPGDTLTYECMVMGSQLGTTVWRGTAFECTSGEISLLHSAYAESSVLRAYGECNNGSIVAQSLSVEDSMCYTSQLNITISADVVGKSIECHYDDSSTTTSQLVGATSIIKGTLLPSPNTVYTSLVDTVSRQIVFNWSPVTPNCPSIHYNILASNCGSCPTTTNHTNVTCTDTPNGASVNNTTECTFAVQAINCNFISGKWSNSIIVLLKESYSATTINSDFSTNNNIPPYYYASLALACIFAAGLMMSVAALVATIVVMYRKRVAKQESTPELATPNATGLGLEIPDSNYENDNMIVMESSLQSINTSENIAYDRVVNA